MKNSKIWLPVSVALVATPALVHAGEWQYQGSSGVFLESYDTDGAAGASPYPIEGDQQYYQLNVHGQYRQSAYEQTRFQFYGVANDSAYRASEQGFIPERMNLRHDKGDAGLPFRVQGGDFLAHFSYLTLQRSLKGVQLELQPRFDDPGALHSLVVLAGEYEFNWRDLSIGEDYFTGVSWASDLGEGGRYLVNYVHNTRHTDTTTGIPGISQDVLSLSAERRFALPGQALTLNSEIGWLEGDHSGAFTSPAETNKSGMGVFVEALGELTAVPLTYSVRGQQYDKDYLPSGAVVPGDQRSVESYLGWRFSNGMGLRGRAQRYEDGFDSATTTETNTQGLTLSGPLTFKGKAFNTYIDTYQQTVETDGGTVDLESQIITARLGGALNPLWFGRAEWFYRHSDDRTTADADVIDSQYQLSADRSLRWRNTQIYISPGLRYLTSNGVNEGDEWRPTLSLRARNMAHELGFYYGYQRQDFDVLTAADNVVENISLDYRFRYGRNTFGIEAQWYERNISMAEDTRANRVVAYWTFSFDQDSLPGKTQYAGVVATGPVRSDLFGLEAWAPLGNAYRALANSGIKPESGIRQGELRVFELRWLDGIDLRQRLALHEQGSSLLGATLVIEFDDIGNTDSARRSYDKVRDRLIRRYGKPDMTYEEGQFDSQFITHVNQEKLIRVDEWYTDAGTLRFGIPRRLDGQVRMELQRQQFFAPVQDTLWSLEALR